MSSTTPNLGLFKYDTITDGNIAFNLQTALNNNWDILDNAVSSGSSRNIGEIVTSTVPLTDAGLHLLDGALISGSGIYSEFVTYIAGLRTNYPDLFTTEANWQTAVTTYGVCGKFVYDSTNNTIRLPKITGFIEGTTDTTALGDLVEAGLPNITGSGGTLQQNITPTGAFEHTGVNSYYNDEGNYSKQYQETFSFDASLSNSIYGNSNTVQPQTIKAFYYIVIATTTKTDIQVDIDEIATDLNGKVDKSSLQEVHCVVETYQNGTSWYRVYSDGWCEQGGFISSGSTTGNVTFMKQFQDTNYSIMTQCQFGVGSGYGYQAGISYVTTSGFNWQNSGSNYATYWQASGYIEV